MPAVARGTPTGNTVRLNYNTATYGTPTWVQIGKINKESLERGKKTYFKSAVREAQKEIQQEGVLEPDKASFNYRRAKGITDTVWTAILAAAAQGAAPMDLFFADDLASLSGATGRRGFFSITIGKEPRDLGAFVEHEIEANEVEHYETVGGVATLIQAQEYTVP